MFKFHYLFFACIVFFFVFRQRLFLYFLKEKKTRTPVFFRFLQKKKKRYKNPSVVIGSLTNSSPWVSQIYHRKNKIKKKFFLFTKKTSKLREKKKSKNKKTRAFEKTKIWAKSRRWKPLPVGWKFLDLVFRERDF